MSNAACADRRVMGYELYRMIRDGAPPDWTPLMRLVAMLIADDARDPSRGVPDDGWPWSALPVETLAERAGVTPNGLSHALTRLARAGYEMRERIGTDSRGRPVFAARGHAMRFRVPPMYPRPKVGDSCDLSRERSAIRASKVGDSCDPISSVPPQVNLPPQNDGEGFDLTDVEAAQARARIRRIK